MTTLAISGTFSRNMTGIGADIVANERSDKILKKLCLVLQLYPNNTGIRSTFQLIYGKL